MILEGRQPSTQALSCIRTPGLSGRYLQRRRIHANRASVPVVTAAATAPAVFDGSASGLRLRRCPQIFLHDVGREPDTFERHPRGSGRSEEHTSELQSLMRISYAVFCLKTKKEHTRTHTNTSTDTN